MRNLKETMVSTFEFIKYKVLSPLKNEKGATVLEVLLYTVFIVGFMVLVFKPQLTTLLTNVLSIWSTDVTTMFNNAQ